MYVAQLTVTMSAAAARSRNVRRCARIARTCDVRRKITTSRPMVTIDQRIRCARISTRPGRLEQRPVEREQRPRARMPRPRGAVLDAAPALANDRAATMSGTSGFRPTSAGIGSHAPHPLGGGSHAHHQDRLGLRGPRPRPSRCPAGRLERPAPGRQAQARPRQRRRAQSASAAALHQGQGHDLHQQEGHHPAQAQGQELRASTRRCRPTTRASSGVNVAGPSQSCFKVVVPKTNNYRTTKLFIGCLQ